MCEMPEYVRENTDALDALGNTTAATGKGFAIGSAVLTATCLIVAFMNMAFKKDVDLSIDDSLIICGLLIGTCMPNIFAALTMLSVGRAAEIIMYEIRKQFY